MSYILLSLVFAGVLVSMALMLFGIIKGQTTFDRILSVNCFTNYTIVLLSLLASFLGKNSVLDIAMIYTLINFIATIGFLRYFKYRTFRD